MSNLARRFSSLNPISLCTFYLVAVSCLLLAGLSALGAATHESGDFAANSVLIQSAKSFSLWMGNYSRVGFNHPGPAILYVLAAGEVVFHDWLHLVAFPFAGQLMAVAFYNALWITLAWVGFYRLTRSTGVALAALSLLLLMLGVMDHEFFTGIWMPNLYLFPFLVALIAIARLIDGRTDSLQALAVSSGFLINGHVSFVGVLGVMLIVSLAGNYLIFRGRDQAARIVLTPTFLGRNSVALGLACLTLALFFVPLLVRTVTQFPGPVREYASFSGGHTANALADSATFVASYWGGSAAAAVGMLVLALAWWACGAVTAESRTRIRALVVSLLSATLALLFYARYGIDMLGEKYVGLFYYAVPALTVAYALMILLASTRAGASRRVILPASLVLLALTFTLINRPLSYNDGFSTPEVPQAFEALKAQRPANGLVLDLDTTNDWTQLWATLATLQAYSARRGEQLFCVNRNWHIVFTRPYRCSDEQVRQGKRLDVTTRDGYADRAPVFSLLGLSFYDDAMPYLAGRGRLTIASNAPLFSRYLLSSGWSVVEPDRVWSEGREARLLLRGSAQSASTLTLDLEAFLPAADATQAVSLLLDGKAVAQVTFSMPGARRTLSIKVPASDQVQVLQILIDHPVSPRDAGLSNDARKLGVALFGLQFDGEQQ